MNRPSQLGTRRRIRSCSGGWEASALLNEAVKNRWSASVACAERIRLVPPEPPIFIERAADAGGVTCVLDGRRVRQVLALAGDGRLDEAGEQGADRADDQQRGAGGDEEEAGTVVPTAPTGRPPHLVE